MDVVVAVGQLLRPFVDDTFAVDVVVVVVAV